MSTQTLTKHLPTLALTYMLIAPLPLPSATPHTASHTPKSHPTLQHTPPSQQDDEGAHLFHKLRKIDIPTMERGTSPSYPSKTFNMSKKPFKTS